MTALPHQYHTPASYLEFERASEEKHEFLAGEIFAMAGASERHNLIMGNTLASLHGQLRGRDCRVYPSDMRVKIAATGLYTYPDISVVCGGSEFEDDQRDTLLNPAVIIEVLSPTTEAYDRGKKFQHYRTLASLQEYLLIAQDVPRIEHYVRQPDNQWLLSDLGGGSGAVHLPSIGCALALVDVYEGVAPDEGR